MSGIIIRMSAITKPCDSQLTCSSSVFCSLVAASVSCAPKCQAQEQGALQGDSEPLMLALAVYNISTERAISQAASGV